MRGRLISAALTSLAVCTVVSSSQAGSEVKLIVYDVFGREVATLVAAKQSAGTYQVKFDAGKLDSGFYLYTLHAGNFVATKEMLFLK